MEAKPILALIWGLCGLSVATAAEKVQAIYADIQNLESIQALFFEAPSPNLEAYDDGQWAHGAKGGVTTLTYEGPQPRIPPSLRPSLRRQSHAITAEVEISEPGAEGALIAASEHFGASVLFVKDGKLQYSQRQVGSDVQTFESSKAVPLGRSLLRLSYERKPEATSGEQREAVVRLFINGEKVAEASLADPSAHEEDAGLRHSDAATELPATKLLPLSETGSLQAFTGTVRSMRFDMASGRNPTDTRYVVD